jgi:hypothetical protein
VAHKFPRDLPRGGKPPALRHAIVQREPLGLRRPIKSADDGSAVFHHEVTDPALAHPLHGFSGLERRRQRLVLLGYSTSSAASDAGEPSTGKRTFTAIPFCRNSGIWRGLQPESAMPLPEIAGQQACVNRVWPQAVKFSAMAFDYDGTIATDGVMRPLVRAANDIVRQQGMVVLLVIGRRIDGLRRVAGDLTCFDAIVAENGAVLARLQGIAE